MEQNYFTVTLCIFSGTITSDVVISADTQSTVISAPNSINLLTCEKYLIFARVAVSCYLFFCTVR